MKFLVAFALMGQAHPVAEIDTVIRDGIDAGIYPGAVVVVGNADSVLLAKGYGRLTWGPDAAVPSPDSTLYDLASLTKVVATTPAMMLLADRGMVDLDAPVEHYLPDFVGENKSAVTVRHLLSHTSGLRAFLPLDTLTENAEEARARVMAEPLRWRPGSRVEYSDLNAMLLGWTIEAAAGMPLDAFVDAELFGPLDMGDTRFNLPRALRSRAAPINVWRGHPIQGVIHDQNAVRLDGVSGHAGLYSTGLDLARYAQWYLRRGFLDDGRSLLRPETVELFTAADTGNRALGWEIRDTTSTENTGALLSPQAFGHGGFTGTSIWIDPARDVFVILLTNRVYAPRTRRSITGLKQVRGRLADASVRLKDRSCRLLASLEGDVSASHC
ncbi:MAG: serine hydrolase [Gemmatimonadetes bacterium]|nr:serine hydrolase [Gemmatimonadota bacterium]